MALIEQQEAAKQIRGNKEYVADCEWLKGYNKACEDNAQIVEQMKGQEIIHCKDCRFWKKYKYFNGKPTYAPFCGFNSIFTDDNDFCSRAEKRGEADG